MVRSVHPEVAGPRLEEAVNRASQAHKAEVSKTTRSTRGMPDMADVLQEWSAEQNVDA
jgi:hypothetical protein